MSDYTKTTDFAAKDSLPPGDSGKVIKGSEFETEFDNIATHMATKYDSTDLGVTLQEYDAGLDAIADLAVTDGNFIVGNGSTWVAESGATARTSLGIISATTSAEGLVELATSAEAIAGSSSTLAVTPAGVAARTAHFAEDGTLNGLTYKDFTIPSGVKRITLMLINVSTSGANDVLIQIADSGGVAGDASGYAGATSNVGTSSQSVTNWTTGIPTHILAATASRNGTLHITRFDSGFCYSISGTIGDSANAYTATLGGSKCLDSEMVTLRVTTVGGDTFDSTAYVSMIFEY